MVNKVELKSKYGGVGFSGSRLVLAAKKKISKTKTNLFLPAHVCGEGSEGSLVVERSCVPSCETVFLSQEKKKLFLF